MINTNKLILIIIIFTTSFAQSKLKDCKFVGNNYYESIIFDSSKANLIYGKLYESYWNPNQIEIESYEKLLIQYLKDNKDIEIDYVHEKCTLTLLNYLCYYKCQYSGVIIKGKRYLKCHYFIYEKDYEKKWKSYLIDVKDGGITIWDVLYNVEENKIEYLRTNGVG